MYVHSSFVKRLGSNSFTYFTVTMVRIELKNPVQIVMHSTPDGKVSVGFGQFIPYADGGKLQVAKSYIGVEADVDQNMSNEYNRIYGSGIVVANTLPPLK